MKKNLIEDLENLSKVYADLEAEIKENPRVTKEDISNIWNLKKQKGEAVINFYYTSFLPNYSGSGSKDVNLINDFFKYYVDLAKKSIDNKHYFKLGVLFLQNGSKIDDKNLLEKLIDQLKSA